MLISAKIGIDYFLKLRKEVMIAFLELLSSKYGGVEQYLKNVVELSENDITTIRNNILIPVSDLEIQKPTNIA